MFAQNGIVYKCRKPLEKILLSIPLRDRRKVEKLSLVSVVFSDLAEMGRWIGLDWGGGEGWLTR